MAKRKTKAPKDKVEPQKRMGAEPGSMESRVASILAKLRENAPALSEEVELAPPPPTVLNEFQTADLKARRTKGAGRIKK